MSLQRRGGWCDGNSGGGSSDGIRSIISCQSDAAGTTGVSMSYDYRGSGTHGGNQGGRGIHYQMGKSNMGWTTSGTHGNTSYVPPENEWVHLSGTYDGQRKRVYMNGRFVSAESDYDDHVISLVDEPLSTLTPLGELEDRLMVLGVVDTLMEELLLLEFTMLHYLEHKQHNITVLKDVDLDLQVLVMEHKQVHLLLLIRQMKRMQMKVYITSNMEEQLNNSMLVWLEVLDTFLQHQVMLQVPRYLVVLVEIILLIELIGMELLGIWEHQILIVII